MLAYFCEVRWKYLKIEATFIVDFQKATILFLFLRNLNKEKVFRGHWDYENRKNAIKFKTDVNIINGSYSLIIKRMTQRHVPTGLRLWCQSV